MELCKLTCHELQELLLDGKASPDKIIDSLMERIESVEKDIKAFVRVNRGTKMPAGSKGGGRLAGIPVLIKDNI